MSRFLFVTLGYHPHPVGGAWRYAAELAERLAARHHDVTVVCGNPENNLPAREVREGVTLLRFPNERGHFFLNWRRENAAARRLVESVEAAASPPSLLGLHQAFLSPSIAAARTPRVMIYQGPWAEEYLFSRRTPSRSTVRRLFYHVIAARLRAVERDALRRSRQIIVLSRYTERLLHGIHSESTPPVKVVPGGVNLRQFTPSPWRAEVRARVGVPSWTRILFVSPRRLDPRMGLDVLLRAYAKVASLPDSHTSQLWLTGDGPEARRLAALIVELGLEKQARLLGRLTDEHLVDVYRAADCAIIPSLELEGFGLATAEALACGTPVLGSLAGATPELLGDLNPHLLFPPGSVDALARKIEDILQGRLSLPTRVQCRQYAEQRFSWDATVHAFEELAGAFAAEGGSA